MRRALALSITVVGAVASGPSLVVTDTATQAVRTRFVREIPWHGRGVWLKADTHTHTRFSDGGYDVAEVVNKAADFGCDVVAVTDHLDVNLTGATPEYFSAIEAARKTHPKTVIFAGGEWNIPPWGGDEHAVVLIAPAGERALADFKRLFDDHRRPTHEASLARDALQWLATNARPSGVAPVVVYEHPSRADDRSAANTTDMRSWRAVNDVVIGFAGAPGHQALRPFGDYKLEQTIDRWDPVVARPGDAWDTLLAEGQDVWAALAPSDFHTDVGTRFNDYWPCQFSATWLYAPRRDAAGVLQALRAGSFFAEHGGIAREAEINVSAPGLPRPASAGEMVSVAPGTTINVEVKLRVPATAWQGANRIDRVEIIAIDATGSKVAFGAAPTNQQVVLHTLRVPKGDLVLRARGYRALASGERLVFYTNPVRVTQRS